MKSSVITENLSGVATIIFFTPDHNALPSSILHELEKKILDAGNDEDTKVIVLKSGGDRTFCAGADFKELLAIKNEEEGTRFFMGFAKVILAIRNCSKLVIGRVQGKAVGGGVGLAAACDYCFATHYAAIKLSEISLGIGPFVIGPAVERKMGINAFTALTLQPHRFYEPQWSLEKGLYNEIFSSAEAMDHEVLKLTQTLAACSSEALLACKKMFWENTEDWTLLLKERAQMSGSLVLSSFTKKALASYK